MQRELKPRQGELKPMRGELKPMQGELKPMRGELKPMRGETSRARPSSACPGVLVAPDGGGALLPHGSGGGAASAARNIPSGFDGRVAPQDAMRWPKCQLRFTPALDSPYGKPAGHTTRRAIQPGLVHEHSLAHPTVDVGVAGLDTLTAEHWNHHRDLLTLTSLDHKLLEIQLSVK
jgi:hypothetical protein